MEIRTERAKIRLWFIASTTARSQHSSSALIVFGIAVCTRFGAEPIVVLGHPGYHPGFGFTPTSSYSIDRGYEVPDEAFMALVQTTLISSFSAGCNQIP